MVSRLLREELKLLEFKSREDGGTGDGFMAKEDQDRYDEGGAIASCGPDEPDEGWPPAERLAVPQPLAHCCRANV